MPLFVFVCGKYQFFTPHGLKKITSTMRQIEGGQMWKSTSCKNNNYKDLPSVIIIALHVRAALDGLDPVETICVT